MNKKQLFKAIGETDPELVAESAAEKKSGRGWIKWACAAACLALAAGVGLFLALRAGNGDSITLEHSTGSVSAEYTDEQPNVGVTMDLIWLTEEQIFSEYQTEIFSVTITDVRNIRGTMNGQQSYRAIAAITVDKVYRGSAVAGDTVTVLLPCSIGNGEWVEDTGVVSKMRSGMTGIFMPIKYGEDDYLSSVTSMLYLGDLAEYGFLDGERYAFIDTGEGLVFAQWAFESIRDAETLGDIEQYVLRMLGGE